MHYCTCVISVCKSVAITSSDGSANMLKYLQFIGVPTKCKHYSFCSRFAINCSVTFSPFFITAVYTPL